MSENRVANADIESVDEAARQRIAAKLNQLGESKGVRVLYAAESGSRAWGFASPDSDYDVRFIYARDITWYLRLMPGRDVIEAGIDDDLIDLSGWDVAKALKLLMRSNPALYEWLDSSIVYVDNCGVAQRAKHIFETYADMRGLAYHYRSIAHSQWHREIENKTDVRLKKYFYVIRPLLSMRWVIENRTPPPMNIHTLLSAARLPGAVADAIEDLITAKRQTPELGTGARIAIIDAWAQEHLNRPFSAPDVGDESRKQAMAKAAERLFHEIIGLVGPHE